MKRLPIPVFLLSLLLIATACRMLTIEDTPIWLRGNWELQNENGAYIGTIEIDSSNIEFEIETIQGYRRFDLFNTLYQNSGWTSSTLTTFTLYLDITEENYCTFVLNDEKSVMMNVQNQLNKTKYVLYKN